jgi:hypothetical protein
MFTTFEDDFTYRHWVPGDPEPLDCDWIRDADGLEWTKGRKAFGEPGMADTWYTTEGDEATWEELLLAGAVKEII